jgi:hypothetical protein
MASRDKTNLKRTARIVAVLTLAMTVVAVFSMMYVPTLIVPNDAAATAQNVLAAEGRFRLSIVGHVMICLIEIALLVALYVLLRPVDKTLSLIAAAARLAMTAIQGMNLAFHLLALELLSGPDSLGTFGPDQLRALALLSLNAHQSVVLIWGTLFALHLFVLGVLVYKSGYIPRVLGIFLIAASLCYVIQDLGTILLPQYKATFDLVGYLSVLEILFPLWLLVKGVRDPQPALA